MNYAPTPRWVKLGGGIVAAVLLIIVLMLLTGHGPAQHFHGALKPQGANVSWLKPHWRVES